MGEVRKDVRVGRSVGRSEGNVGKYGEILENVGRFGKVCWNVRKVRVVWGNMGRCVWGVGRDVGNVLGWVEVRRSVGRGGVWENVGRGLGREKKCGEW